MIYLITENGNKALNGEFNDFKAGSKILISEGYLGHIKPISNVRLTCLEVKLHGCKFLRCVKRIKC